MYLCVLAVVKKSVTYNVGIIEGVKLRPDK